MRELKHADVICHMAKHGFESVEGKPPGIPDYFNWQKSTLNHNPTTKPDWGWRIKPATITYSVTVPEPMRVMPKDGQDYWMLSCDGVAQMEWDGDAFEEKIFESGNVWDTGAKAQAAFDALFGPLRRNL